MCCHAAWPAASYLWKLQILPRKCHGRLISAAVVNTGILLHRRAVIALSLSASNVSMTPAQQWKKKLNPSKSLRGRLRWPVPLCGSGYLRSMSIWGKRHLKNRLCTFKALNGQTVRSLRKQQQQKQNKTKQRFWVNLSIISSMRTLKV